MRDAAARVLWGGSGAACAAVVCAVIVFPWGMWVGARDVRLLQAAERQAAFAACGDPHAVLVRLAPDRHRPERDVWRCVSGSLRMQPRVADAPLAHPLTGARR